MRRDARRREVRARLESHGEVMIAELALEFRVSEMTVRRDLESLEDEGVARRVKGGAIRVASRSYEPSFAARAVEAADVKSALAQVASGMIDSGESVILDSGTTVIEFAKALRHGDRRLSVMTCSIGVAAVLAEDPQIRVMMTGGLLRPGELSLVGPETEACLQSVNCDVCVLSVSGISIDHGLTEYTQEEARVKQAAIRSARRVIAVIDERKFGRVHFANVIPIAQVDVLITNADPKHDVILAAIDAGVEVVHVPPRTH